MEKYKLVTPIVATQTVYFSDHPLSNFLTHFIQGRLMLIGMHGVLSFRPFSHAFILKSNFQNSFQTG